MDTPQKTAIRRSSGLGPLGDHAARFGQSLSDRNYAKDTIARYLRCLALLAQAMEREGVALEDLYEAQAVALVGENIRRGRSATSRAFVVGRFARFLADQSLGKPPAPPTLKEFARAELKRNYETYLRRQRGLSERTIFHCWRFADRFLEFRFGDAVEELSQITSDDIARFLQQLTTRRRSPFRGKTSPTHLRNFFRYLFKAGKTPINLALSMPSVKRQYGARLPRHLAPEQVDTLIDAVGSGAPDKLRRRNYAMVLLLARLGLRATEVIATRLDDIDWRAGEIIVRGKGDRHDRVPLPRDVGEALAEYIRFERIATSRTLFVTARRPHRPFKDGQVLNEILKAAFARTGLKPPAPYVGSHVLRHSLAVHLARCGASLEEIGDLLRHRSRASTMIYARLDLEGLRSIAQPWPVAGSAQ